MPVQEEASLVEQATTVEALVAGEEADCVGGAEEETAEGETGEGGRAAMAEVEAGLEAAAIH